MGDILVTSPPAMPSLDKPFDEFETNSPRRSLQASPLPAFSFPQGRSSVTVDDSDDEASDDADFAPSAPGTHPPVPRMRQAPPKINPVNTLPSFSFNPGASLGPPAGPVPQELTPPESPTGQSEPTTPTRTRRHRRMGSEFIGGDIKHAAVVTREPSPSKSVSDPSPQPSPGQADPPRHVRGHGHRRSGAVSSRDLSNLRIPGIPTAVVNIKPAGLPDDRHSIVSAPSTEGLPVSSPIDENNTLRPSSSPPLGRSPHFAETGSLQAARSAPKAITFAEPKKVDHGRVTEPRHSKRVDKDDDEPTIDLNDALDRSDDEDMLADGEWSASGSASRLRNSMYDSSEASGDLSSQREPFHRRAESAPSYPANSSRPDFKRFYSNTASEKGFKMTDVFEEDEEEGRTRKSLDLSTTLSKGQSPRLSPHGSNGGSRRHSREVWDKSQQSTSKPNTSADLGTNIAPMQQRNATVNERTPATFLIGSNGMDTEFYSHPLHGIEQSGVSNGKVEDALGLSIGSSLREAGVFTEPSVSTARGGSSSTFSTPRLETGTSSFVNDSGNHDARDGRGTTASSSHPDAPPESPFSSLSFRNSIIGRNLLRSHSSHLSIDQPSVGSGASGHSRRTRQSSKRLSVISLSGFLPGMSDRRGSQREDERCQTSDGFGMEEAGKSKTKQRLSRLKFWKRHEQD